MLRGRINSLRTLAEATDGLAIVDSNNLAGGLKRVDGSLQSAAVIRGRVTDEDGDPLADIRILQDKSRILTVAVGGQTMVEREAATR